MSWTFSNIGGEIWTAVTREPGGCNSHGYSNQDPTADNSNTGEHGCAAAHCCSIDSTRHTITHRHLTSSNRDIGAYPHCDPRVRSHGDSRGNANVHISITYIDDGEYRDSATYPMPTPTASPVSVTREVQIVCIFFDGETARTEPDEYVEIINSGTTAADLTGCTLLDSADGRPSFEFHALTLASGEIVRVYTNEVHSSSCGFSFGSGVAI